MALQLTMVAPSGHRTARAFFCGELRTVADFTYPASPEGEALRAFRVDIDGPHYVNLREAAKRLGIRASELSDLEMGRAMFTEPEMWTEARRLIRPEWNR